MAHKDPEERRAYLRRYTRRLREQALDAYGRFCRCCGEEHEEFLTIDHVYNDGKEHRAKRGSVTWLIDVARDGFPDRYQVLCFNCNWAKFKHGECPHQKALHAITG